MGFDVLTKQEAARRARIPARYLRLLIKDGKGPAVTHIGHRVLIRTDALRAWLESCTAVTHSAVSASTQ